jgi:hypothetical protein
VIEGDPGDRGDRRVDGGGGVEPSAQADLEDRDRGRGRGQDLEPDRGDLLEEGQVVATGCGDPGVGLDHRGLVGQAPVDGEALAQAGQVRRGVDPDPGAGGPRHRRDQGRRRALAVGAADMDDRAQAALGVIERGEDRAHAVEAEHDPGPTRREQARQDPRVGRRHDRPTTPARPRRRCRRRRGRGRG